MEKSREGFDFTYLCLGAGVQSSALVAACDLGLEINGYKFPRPDVVIFADTQADPPWILEQVGRLQEKSSLDIRTVTAGNLGDDSLYGKPGLNKFGKPYNKFVTLPVYGLNPDGTKTLLRRQCTREYKIDPIEKEIRKLLGYKKGQRIKESARALLGISLEEAQRMKPSRTSWVTNEYPLVEARLRRHDCHRILKESGYPAAKRSACTFCPFHTSEEWAELKKNAELWEEIVAFDKAIRNLSRKGKEAPVFLHPSCKPIDEIDFSNGGQLEFPFINGCDEGHCGI
tara:strand:- start:627 stop:1481 length:855 start_codon:yes stop_codon:yes gene_type:complete